MKSLKTTLCFLMIILFCTPGCGQNTSETDGRNPQQPSNPDIIEVYDLTDDMISVDPESGEEYINSIIVIGFTEGSSEKQRTSLITCMYFVYH